MHKNINQSFAKKKEVHPAIIEIITADEKLVEFFTFSYLSATFVLGREKICKTLDFSYFYNGKSVVIYMKKETFFGKMDYFVIIRGISCFNCCKRLFPTHILVSEVRNMISGHNCQISGD